MGLNSCSSLYIISTQSLYIISGKWASYVQPHHFSKDQLAGSQRAPLKVNIQFKGDEVCKASQVWQNFELISYYKAILFQHWPNYPAVEVYKPVRSLRSSTTLNLVRPMEKGAFQDISPTKQYQNSCYVGSPFPTVAPAFMTVTPGSLNCRPHSTSPRPSSCPRRLRAHLDRKYCFPRRQQLASDDHNFLEINDFENSSMRLPLLLLLNYNQVVISSNQENLPVALATVAPFWIRP